VGQKETIVMVFSFCLYAVVQKEAKVQQVQQDGAAISVQESPASFQEPPFLGGYFSRNAMPCSR
jgi:hypothetical protein